MDRYFRVSSPNTVTTLLVMCAIALHWILAWLIGPKTPYFLFVPVIILATVIAGRMAGLIVVAIGLVNGILLHLPFVSLANFERWDIVAATVYSVVGILLTVAGHYHRRTLARAEAKDRELQEAQIHLQQQVADLQELHELNSKLPTIQSLHEQLQEILRVLVNMHDAQLGLVSLLDNKNSELKIAASIGFSKAGIDQLRGIRAGQGACGTACTERKRVIIEDIETDASFAPFRTLARNEGFKAVHSTPLLSQWGEILGAISVHFDEPRRPTDRELQLADIFARKAAVYIERAIAEEQVKERDQRFRTVLESSAVPFVILRPVRDTSGKIFDFRWAYLNAAAARLLNRRPEELLERRISEEIPAIWEYSGLFEEYVRVADFDEVNEFEIEAKANGSKVWLHNIASPLNGSVAVWFADVTHRKVTEQALRDAHRRKDEFLATLAHELRNPLAPIRQAAMIAGTSSATDTQKRWSYSVIERQVQHMSLLLDDLLDVSRITRGRLQLRKEPTDFASIVNAAIEVARPLIESKRHKLALALPSNPVTVNADPLRLAQVLSNLLTNAAKYTDPQGLLRIAANCSGKDIVVTIADNGIGIEPNDLSKLFEMFSQVKSAQERSEGGLGIGLALTKGLVELHGGSIRAESDGAGRGSTFTLTLPIVDDSAMPATSPAARRVPQLRLTRRVLIADDNRDAAESLSILLQADGHDVIVAHDGAEAYQLYLDRSPEVLLLDIGMPRLSGYEVAKRVRAHSADPVLIAITGWGQEADKSQAYDVGFDFHMTKPVDYDALISLLQPGGTKAAHNTNTR